MTWEDNSHCLALELDTLLLVCEVEQYHYCQVSHGIVGTVVYLFPFYSFSGMKLGSGQDQGLS